MAESHAAGAPEPAPAPDSAGAQDKRAPVVTAPVLPAGPPKMLERSGSRLGRSALFVHGLGVAFALVAATVLYFGAWDFHGDDPFVLMSVGGGALIVCTLWSLILAVRAARSSERLLLPAVLGLIVWTEASAALLALWLSGIVRLYEASYWPTPKAVAEGLLDLALPALLPVTLFAVLLAWPLAWWIVRRIEARRRARGADVWTPAQRGRAKRRAFAACLALFSLLLLPVPVVLYCASVSTYEGSVEQNRYVYWGYDSPGSSRGRGKDWMAELVCRAPDFVTHLAERSAAQLPGSEMSRARGAFVRFLVLSDDRLEAIVADSADPLAPAAFVALQQSNSERAAAMARRMWSSSGSMVSGQTFNFLVMLDPETAKLLSDDLTEFCFKGPSQQIQEAAFSMLVNSASRDKVVEVFTHWTHSLVPADRLYFYRRLCWMIGDDDLFFEFVVPGLDEKDPAILCAALVALSSRLYSTGEQRSGILRKVFRRCVKLLEDGHPEVRRFAALLIVDSDAILAIRNERNAVAMAPYISPASPMPAGWLPPPVYEKIRAAAEQWLKEHGE